MFSIRTFADAFARNVCKVSVPSRGLCFQSGGIYELLRCVQKKFPSPLGDYVFNHKNNRSKMVLLRVSVPSRGLCFQSIAKLYFNSLASCFRPLSGIMFSIFFPRTYTVYPICFRPLSWIMFSIDYGAYMFFGGITVSVPSRGLCFQSDTDCSIMESSKEVSVPSRGLCFQSLSAKTCTLPYSALIVAAQMHKVVYIH